MNVRELYPDMGDDFYGPGDYTPIIEALGEVIVREDDKNWQGDTLVLLKKDGQFGYLRIGWGSCSGCDALQDCRNYDALQTLADEIADNVNWLGDASAALKFIEEHDWEGSYAAQDDTRAKFIANASGALKAVLP